MNVCSMYAYCEGVSEGVHTVEEWVSVRLSDDWVRKCVCEWVTDEFEINVEVIAWITEELLSEWVNYWKIIE